jgi:hypothetical protein
MPKTAPFGREQPAALTREGLTIQLAKHGMFCPDLVFIGYNRADQRPRGLMRTMNFPQFVSIQEINP